MVEVKCKVGVIDQIQGHYSDWLLEWYLFSVTVLCVIKHVVCIYIYISLSVTVLGITAIV